MKQSALFKNIDVERPYPKAVNVASVPQRSPFRYPGGKTWFVPTFREWINNMAVKPRILVEPFAGGGIISLTALFENLVDKVVMVEKDEEIAAVWQTVVDGHADWIADRILAFEITKDNLIKELKKDYKDIKHIAFQTILKNRTFHGGILAEGAGILKHGENGKGILSRWYPKTIAKRFRNLSLVASRIDFICGDGLQVIKDYATKKDAVFFVDPPYTAGGKRAGRRLYRHYEIDHEQLFQICESLEGDFLMTYDMAEEVKSLTRNHGFEMKPVAMRTTHHTEMTELVIGRNLSWMSDAPRIEERKEKYKVRKGR